METNVIIKQQFPLKERQYADKAGQTRTFASRGFELSDGIDTFYAEMTGDRARNIGELDPQHFYHASLELRARTYQAANGENVWVNDIYINNMKPIF